MSPRPRFAFLFRFWSLAGEGFFHRYRLPNFHSLKNRAAHRSTGARPTELLDERTCGWHSACSGIGGWHREESFFEVLVVPFV